MTDTDLEFIVAGVVEGEYLTVIGRCGGAPIHVGDVFDTIYRYKPLRYPDEMGDDPMREIERPAAIRVICIHAFERSIKTMGEGMTGSLSLEGEGLHFLAPGWILGRKSEESAIVDHGSHPATVLS